MSYLNYDQQQKMIGTRKINQNVSRYVGERDGDHKAFQDRVNKFRVSNGLKAQEVKR
jgi:hypothetical protein